MSPGILQTGGQQRGLVLDPRTKLLLLITVSTFVLGGLGGKRFSFIMPILSLLTLLLFAAAGKIGTAVRYFGIYS